MPLTPHLARQNAISDILDERKRQDEKWGVQHHPDVPNNINPPMALKIANAFTAIRNCDEAFKRGEGTWGHILVEEVAEAVAEAADDAALRAELVQVAAVALAWIEDIDTRRITNATNR